MNSDKEGRIRRMKGPDPGIRFFFVCRGIARFAMTIHESDAVSEIARSASFYTGAEDYAAGTLPAPRDEVAKTLNKLLIRG